jgi:hypothetical protein
MLVTIREAAHERYRLGGHDVAVDPRPAGDSISAARVGVDERRAPPREHLDATKKSLCELRHRLEPVLSGDAFRDSDL